jgi:hypothetical protein
VLHLLWLFLAIAHLVLTKQQVVNLRLCKAGNLVNGLRLHAALIVCLLTHRELVNHILVVESLVAF